MRNIYIFGNDFWDFYNAQQKNIQKKIDWVIGLVKTLPIVPEKYFKHLEGTDGLFEIRVIVGTNSYRIFCFFDQGNLVILLNCFPKKSNKTPRQEIERAKHLRKQYYEEKSKN